MILSFKNVWFSYDRSDYVLKDVSFSIKDGEKVALLGLNGSGKSTLMLHTNGLMTPKKGEVFVNGKSTTSKSIKEIRENVGLVFQNPDDQLFMPTVKDDVAFGPRNMLCSEEEVEKRVKEALILTKTLDLINKSPFELSGGQKKSVSIATVLSMSPEILVMDEPTSGLDFKGINNFIEIVESLPISCLISTHDVSLAKRLCTRALVIDKGNLIYDGEIHSVPYLPRNS